VTRATAAAHRLQSLFSAQSTQQAMAQRLRGNTATARRCGCAAHLRHLRGQLQHVRAA
jgi:hypothetical protein